VGADLAENVPVNNLTRNMNDIKVLRNDAR
jgi:hypothetical protein